MVAFIDRHREVYGVAPICADMPIARLTYYDHKARERGSRPQPPRECRDRWLIGAIRRVWESGFGLSLGGAQDLAGAEPRGCDGGALHRPPCAAVPEDWVQRYVQTTRPNGCG